MHTVYSGHCTGVSKRKKMYKNEITNYNVRNSCQFELNFLAQCVLSASLICSLEYLISCFFFLSIAGYWTHEASGYD